MTTLNIEKSTRVRINNLRRDCRTYDDIINRIIEAIEKMPPWLPIGDFGCGEAFLADKFENRVQSFDAVAHDSRVTACNIKNVPVKDGGLGIAVFCQSLMGTKNSWPEYIQEAARCLPKNGILLIAESTQALGESRLGNLRKVIKENGFEFNQEGCYDEYKFTFIEARKI